MEYGNLDVNRFRSTDHYEPVVRDGVSWLQPRDEYRGSPQSPVRKEPSAVSPKRCVLPRRVSLFGLFCRPWARWWKWLLLADGVACAVLLSTGVRLPSRSLVFLGTLFGVLAVPSAMTCLFAEWDVSRRTSVLRIVCAVIAGVVVELVAGVLNNAFHIINGCISWAAVVEEPLKAVIVLVFALKGRKTESILTGLSLGCAVGAGFSTVETMEYVYGYGKGALPSIDILMFRTLLAPFMHMSWTGAFGGAVWAANGAVRGWRTVLARPMVYLVLAGMILCHAVWNTAWFYVPLAAVSWVVLLTYVRKGIKQAFERGLVSEEFWE
jgi:protease PrsW